MNNKSYLKKCKKTILYYRLVFTLFIIDIFEETLVLSQIFTLVLSITKDKLRKLRGKCQRGIWKFEFISNQKCFLEYIVLQITEKFWNMYCRSQNIHYYMYNFNPILHILQMSWPFKLLVHSLIAYIYHKYVINLYCYIFKQSNT